MRGLRCIGQKFQSMSVTTATPARPVFNTADKGLEFEKFVMSRFNPAQFRLLDNRSTAIYPLSAHDPHLVYQLSSKKSSFAIECRFRERDYRNKFTWAEDFQLQHYLRFEQKTQMLLFIIIGIGGLPSKPTNVYVIPFKEISGHTTLALDQFKNYERSNGDTGFFFDGVTGKLK